MDTAQTIKAATQDVTIDNIRLYPEDWTPENRDGQIEWYAEQCWEDHKNRLSDGGYEEEVRVDECDEVGRVIDTEFVTRRHESIDEIDYDWFYAVVRDTAIPYLQEQDEEGMKDALIEAGFEDVVIVDFDLAGVTTFTGRHSKFPGNEYQLTTPAEFKQRSGRDVPEGEIIPVKYGESEYIAILQA